MKAFSFENINVLLTGGTGEIGHGFLAALAKRQVGRVYVAGSHLERLNRLKNDFLMLDLHPIEADLSTEKGIDDLLKYLQNSNILDQIHLVIFNAGYLGLEGIQSYPSWDNALRALALNVLSPEFCFRKLVDAGLLKPGACVLVAGSIAGHISYPDSKNISPYSISKAGLHRAVKNWAMDHSDMTIFELAFGAVKTKMLDQCRPPYMTAQEWLKTLNNEIPIGEIAQPDILAETVLQLLETPGYRLFHGDVVQLSGGEHNA